MKSKPNGAYVTHMNSDFGMISVMKQSCTAPISKVACHILDRFLYSTLMLCVNIYSDCRGSRDWNLLRQK